MTEYQFTLHISTEEYLQFYEGLAKSIQVTSHCGKIIQFPAEKMREFILNEGVHGHFVISLDNNNKFLAVKKLNDYQ